MPRLFNRRIIKMIEAFIKIRIKQFSREIDGIGLFRLVFLVGLFSYLSFIVFQQSKILPNAYYILGIYLFTIASIHLKRKDKLFLKRHFTRYKLIYSIEYSTLTLPLFICLLYHTQWLLMLILILSLSLITQWDFQTKNLNLNTKIQQWIPQDSFEWKSGIRKSFFYIVPLWLLSLGTSFYIGSIPIAIFILGIIPLNFYERSEPYQMLIAYEMNTNRFLWHKVKIQTLLFSITTLPLILAFIFFHYERWYIPTVEYLIFITLHVYLILTKYAFYEPNTRSSATITFGAIGTTGALVPIFLPAVWLLGLWFYFKTKKNLNFYLNDYN